MTTTNQPAQPGQPDARHAFLSAKEVIARAGWGRTYGYQMLRSEGFPRPIGGRYRLDTLIAWEERVLSGELDGRPASTEAHAAFGVDLPATDNPAGPVAVTAPAADPTRRRRSRGTVRAA